MRIDYNQLGIWARDIGLALLILIAAHFAAKAVKWAIAKGVDRIPFLSRRDSAGNAGAKPAVDVGERVGEVGYWVVWLIGLIAALNQLGQNAFPGLRGVTDPLNTMLNGFVSYVPQIVGAALIFFIGFVLATIARRMVEAAAEAAEIDRRLHDAGLTHMPRGPGLARMIGAVVFALIIIPVSIQALSTLNINAISQPATLMLEGIGAAIPNVIGAMLIIVVAYVIGRWVAALVENGLRSIGFDDIIRSIARADSVRSAIDKMDPTPGVDTVDLSAFPPSRMIGLTVLIAIVLFASVEAANALQFTAMAAMLSQVVSMGTQVLFGAVIIALGVLLANILSAATSKSGTPSSELLSVFVRWGVIVLAVAMGLRFMGLANEIIVLAFGLILGAVAVAVAIAFGIGGRDAAKRLMDRWTA
ncbi:small-conductance mechanosensitive channel [alpha proteobacterium U9-1i]|nr:small-conductance mechanosensitive channel [alpha proteobacterium U9-1i]